MAKEKSVTTSKKVFYAGLAYVKEREQYNWTQGVFRCFGIEDGKPKCEKLCDKCEDYYR